MLRVYLDNCCYNRPFDLPSSPAVIFESSAKMLIQTLILNEKVELVSSFVLHEEMLANSNADTRRLISDFLANAKAYVAKDKIDLVRNLASQIMLTGIKYMDASHVACSIIAGSDYFITTDKRLLKYNSDKVSIINPVDFIHIWEEYGDAGS
jgi:predicted nucleic acid-binding protein